METFSVLLAICAGNSPVNSPHKGQWQGALIYSFICTWINGSVNNREAGDLRHHRAHYDDVNVMSILLCSYVNIISYAICAWLWLLCFFEHVICIYFCIISSILIGFMWSLYPCSNSHFDHYNDVIMGTMASQITSLALVYLTIYSGADQRNHQSSASLAFVRGDSPHKWPLMRKMFPFDDIIMQNKL